MKKYRKIPHIVEAMQVSKNTQLDNLHLFPDRWYYLPESNQLQYGDYLVKGIDGKYYPVKKDIFDKSYEEVKNEKI